MYRLGTRASELAQTQSLMVADMLRRHGLNVELELVRTEGDVTSGSLTKTAGTGVFAAALRHSLVSGGCDLAVHSYKDLPSTPWPGLVVAACPQRASSQDVLCAADHLSFSELPSGARIGTGSPRRAAQLRHLRPDVVTVDIRGNVGTRLGRVRGLIEGGGQDLDAVVLARAGLERLGQTAHISHVFEASEMLPAPAQGVLAIEVRTDSVDPNHPDYDADLAQALAHINDLGAYLAAAAEQQVLATLNAGCAAPVGALAVLADTELSLVAAALSTDGSKRLEVRDRTQIETGASSLENLEKARELGQQVARQLLEKGAAEITDLQATKGSQKSTAHDESSLWAAGISGATDPNADVKVKG